MREGRGIHATERIVALRRARSGPEDLRRADSQGVGSVDSQMPLLPSRTLLLSRDRREARAVEYTGDRALRPQHTAKELRGESPPRGPTGDSRTESTEAPYTGCRTNRTRPGLAAAPSADDKMSGRRQSGRGRPSESPCTRSSASESACLREKGGERVAKQAAALSVRSVRVRAAPLWAGRHAHLQRTQTQHRRQTQRVAGCSPRSQSFL